VIENLSHLSELRVLNLAGNIIDTVGCLRGMNSLTELNLRRNMIQTVVRRFFSHASGLYVNTFFLRVRK